eukprot:CFRG7360T1
MTGTTSKDLKQSSIMTNNVSAKATVVQAVIPSQPGSSDENNGGYGWVNVTDFTDIEHAYLNLTITFRAWVGTTLMFLWQSLVIVVFTPLMIFSVLTSGFIPLTLGVRRAYGIGCLITESKYGTKKLPLSIVNASTPNVYSDYQEFLLAEGRLEPLRISLSGGTSTQTERKPDLNLAHFFCHLCALSYEDSEVILYVLKYLYRPLFGAMYGQGRDAANDKSNLKFQRFGHDSLAVLAVWSVKHNFIVLTFKGTSPLDLSEWLIDSGLEKSFPQSGMLAGGVHRGFYRAFQLPDEVWTGRDVPPFPRGNRCGEDMHKGEVPLFFALNNLLNDVILKDFSDARHQNRLSPSSKPQLWITGHSLGAATASVFTAIMLYTSRSALGQHHRQPSINWDKTFDLKGTYTFGTPRTGDKNFQDAISVLTKTCMEKDGFPNYPFHGIINGNDVVCSGPLSGRIFLSKKQVEESYYVDPANILNYHHLGVPYKMKYMHTPSNLDDEIGSPRVIWDLPGNMIRSVLYSVYRLAFNPFDNYALDALAVLEVVTGGSFGFIHDHFPSCYIANLQDRITVTCETVRHPASAASAASGYSTTGNA